MNYLRFSSSKDPSIFSLASAQDQPLSAACGSNSDLGFFGGRPSLPETGFRFSWQTRAYLAMM